MEQIQIPGIQHYVYCKRQWGLLYIENLWVDNYLTLDGDKIHENAHDYQKKESRNDKFIERGTYINSEKYNLTGQCDIIEYIKDDNGICLANHDDKWKIIPVEYKHGDGSSIDIDKYQLFAQILCLEEMFQTKINDGYIYYKKSNKKIKISFLEQERNELEKIIFEMNELLKKQYTPKVKYSRKKCANCSMLDICNPKIFNQKNIKNYIQEVIE